MEIVSVSVLSNVLSLDKFSCPQIWNIEKDREKENVGDRPAKKRRHFLLKEQNENFAEAVRK